MFCKAKAFERKNHKLRPFLSRITAAVLAASVFAGFVPGELVQTAIVAFAEDTVTDEQGLTYTLLEDGTYSVSGCDESAVSVVIPEEYNGICVTNIGDSAFENCESLEDVFIPQSVTNIGYMAFYNCSNLTHIELSDNTINISSYAFMYCDKLSSIEIPNKVTYIGSHAFERCISLKSIRIPDGVTRINNDTFSSCFNLESIVLPNNLTSIEPHAFAYCNLLFTVEIPKGVTQIRDCAFYFCNNLSSVYIHNGDTQVGTDAFLRCPTVTIYSENNSIVERYAKENNINFVEIKAGGATSENGTLKTDIWLDNNGYINIPALSVDFLYCNIADSESGYTPSDITWTSSDSSIVSIEKVVGNEDSVIDIPEISTQSACYIAALNEGYATVTASLPNGESLEFPIFVTEQEDNCDFDWSYVPTFKTTAYGEWSNQSHIKLSIYNNASDNYDSPVMLEVYNDMLKDPLVLEQLTLNISNLNISLPKNFSFSSEKSSNNTDGEMQIIDGDIYLKPGEQYDLEIPIYYHGDALINNQKTVVSQCSVSFLTNGKTSEYTNLIYINNLDYVPESDLSEDSVPQPEEPNPDEPYVPKPGVTVDADNPLSAFENCYKSYLNEKCNTTSSLRSSFRDLQKYISNKSFNKIIADTEMFCTLEMLSLPSGGDYSLDKIFGYDGFKATSFLNIGKKALLEFPDVAVNENFYHKKKTVTVFVELDNTGASIGGATASWCTASWYIKLSDTDCIKGGEKAQIVYSSLSSLNYELKQIYANNTHTNGTADDYIYWIKLAIKDYTGVALSAQKVEVKTGESIVNLVDKLYRSVSNGNLNAFRLSSISDINKLFKNVYNIASGKYKLISILCPVDVEISDSDGNVLGSVKDNKVEITSDDVQMSVNGDKKYCRISLYDDYNIYLSGTDSGAMNYIIEEVLDDEVIRTVRFDNLELSDTINYTGQINNVILQSDEAYSLTNNDGNVISSYSDTYSFSLAEFSDALSTITIPETVTVLKNNSLVRNGDKIVSGDVLCVNATVPDGKRLASLTIDGVPVENGKYFTVGYDDVVIDVSSAIVIQVSTPVINPNGGAFSGTQEVTISCDTDGANIYYTTDGTVPTTESRLYTGAITLTGTTTVKAVAVKNGMADSIVATAAFTKKSGSGGGGSSGGGGGSSSSRPVTPPEPNKPSIGGFEKSWSEVAADLSKLTTGSEVTIQLNGNTTVPADIIKAIADKDSKVIFVINSVFSWVVDGSKITTPVAADLTLTKTASTKSNGLCGAEGTQFRINNTGVPTSLEISFKTEHAGKFANLYKSVDGNLTFVTCAKLGEDGKVILPYVTEKGDYVAMLCEFSNRPGDTDNDGIMNAKDASAILKDIVGLEPSKNPLMADFNGDGHMNAMDASAILKRIVGLA